MPGQAPRRRARGLTPSPVPTEDQILWHRVVVEVADPRAAEQLARMHQRAEHDVAPLATVRLTVTGDAGAGYQVFDNGDLLARVGTPRQVLDEVFARAHRRAFELASLKGWVRFHGAVLTVDGSRIAVVGDSGAGKTTLAMAVLAGGGAVETDESFVARDGEVFSVARRFHVKPGTAELVPSAPWLADAPVLDGDPPLQLVDPTEHGLAWRLPVGPVDHVVQVERTSGASRLEPVGASVVVQGLIAESFPVVESRAVVVRQASAVVAGVPTHRLANGPDGVAPELLRSLTLRRGG